VFTDEFKIDAIPIPEVPIHAAYTEGPYAIDCYIGRSGQLAVAPQGSGPGHCLRRRLANIGLDWQPFTTAMSSVAFNGMSPNHGTCPVFGHGDYGGSQVHKKWTDNIWKAFSNGVTLWRKVVGSRLQGASKVPDHVTTAFQQSIRPPLDRAPNDFDEKGYPTASKREVAPRNATLSPLALGVVGELIGTAEQATSGSTLHFMGLGGNRLFGYPAHLDDHWQGALKNGAISLSEELLTSVDTGIPHLKGTTTMAHAV
jgi:hypothetical protein